MLNFSLLAGCTAVLASDSIRKFRNVAFKLIQLRFAPGCIIPHCHAMDALKEKPEKILVVALFCAIIGIIGFSGFMH